MAELELDPRARKILHSLISQYLQDGNPVASRTLANMAGFDWSAATVRNVMADLEDFGFLVSPHTSAGRIPSAQGMRFFVDQLLTVPPPSQKTVKCLEENMRGNTAADIQRGAASVVSQLTKYAGFVAAPAAAVPVVRKLRFVKLSSSRVLAVIVTDGGDILNRIFVYDGDASEEDLNAAAAIYNRHFSGVTLGRAQTLLRGQLLDLRERIASLLRALLERVGADAEEGAGADALQVAGEINLLGEEDLSGDIDRLRKLYDLLERKKELLALLERGGAAENVRVFIGSECGLRELEECSVVFSSARSSPDGRALGVVGIIGPKRMRYNQVISTVGIAATLLGGMLDDIRSPG